ncbi:allophanate hydrolase [Nocardia cyriacigeorgica]|uniref:Allophanate hydrolase n=1 Tax=Nocardia cyriacigeorgica TaxID=135487 RepID=A0ABX0CZ65_9NOCA|nr:allophanate hydrolase [Nocardia cyriacigeorgica]NEW58844.1 allophanate hydrolase [Nocardia cyriacigeorgica]
MSAGILGNTTSPTARVAAAYRRIAEVDRPEVWITLRSEPEVIADAAVVERQLAAGAELPLAGLLVAVKDNVDVAGLPTTAGCPEFAYTPEVTAAAIERLTSAGAVVLGKTNLDQFATGLVGTRSPYGPVRNAAYPELVSGGSSSGSAVAVALGIADIGIGTDTAGSGRVPAALQGIVGIKATLGVIPVHGVVPACADFDAVTVFAADIERAVAAAAIMAGPDSRDPRSRTRPADLLLAAPTVPKVAVPRAEDLTMLSASYREAFTRTAAGLSDSGVMLTEIDISVLLDAALLLYDGAIVAERFAAVGDFLSSASPDALDPTVAGIIRAAEHTTGPGFAADLDALITARAAARGLLDGYDGLLLPTTTEHPTIAAVQADPIAINRRMGTFTNFCNLLDMAAVAVPGSPTVEGSPFGVMVMVPAFADQVAIDIAARLAGTDSTPALFGHDAELAVFGAHLRGHPLHWQLEQIGARFAGEIRTTDAYCLTALDTTPPKPGLVRHGPGLGAPITGELFQLSAAGLGSFLAALPAPMALAGIELEDGRTVVGFACTYDAAVTATDITEFGGWKKYLEQLG